MEKDTSKTKIMALFQTKKSKPQNFLSDFVRHWVSILEMPPSLLDHVDTPGDMVTGTQILCAILAPLHPLPFGLFLTPLTLCRPDPFGLRAVFEQKLSFTSPVQAA